MHADHHLGLVAILEARTRLCPTSPLLVIGPQAMRRWLQSAAAAIHLPIDFRYVHNGDAPNSPAVGAALRRMGFEVLKATTVEHCMDAWALGLQHADGWSVVYSGDTRPCDNVVRLGRNMRPGGVILIHEAVAGTPTPYLSSPTTCLLPSPRASFLPPSPTSCLLPPASFFHLPPPTSHHPPLTSHLPSPTSHLSPLTTNLLLITCYT